MPTSSHSTAPSSRCSCRGVLRSFHRQQPVDVRLDRGLGLPERVVVGRHRRQRRAAEIVRQRVGNDEVAVGQPLHQRARAEAVGAVIGEVRLAEHVQARDRAHQVVVDPEAAHRVVDRGVDPHRHAVGILVGDLRVHVEEVAVAPLDDVRAEPLDRVREVQVDREAAVADAASFVADRLRVPRRHVARHQVAEARIAPLEVVVALGFRNLLRAAACRPASSAPRRARRCGGSRSSA